MRHISRAEMTRVYEEVLGNPLPGATPQGIMEESATQRHYLGARLQEPITGRVFRYAHADADRQLRAAYGVFPDVDYPETGTVAVAAAVGTKVITCTAVADVTLNEFADGLMGLAGGGTSLYGEQYRIKSNTAATAGNTFTVTLYDALVHALTVADLVTLFHNPWHRVISQRQRFIDGVTTDYEMSTVCGVPNRFVQADYYCWVQVKGPCLVVGDAGNEGVAANERLMMWTPVGSVGRFRDAGDGLGRYAFAGNLLPVTTAGAIPNSLVPIWLDIAGA